MATGELHAARPLPTIRPARARPSHHHRWFGPGWQIGAFIVGYPVWWVLGITQFMPLLITVPLALQLRARGRVKIPPGFWLWLLFLVWAAVSVVTLNVTVEGTLPPHGFGRYLAFSIRFLNYLALTVVMLYVGNRSEQELPRRRVIGWLAALGAWVIALGILAVLFPHAESQNLVSRLLPTSLLGEERGGIRLAQVQGLLGDPSPRPAAPFAYTNTWGNSLSLLLVWLAVWTLVARSHWRAYLLMTAGFACALVPVVYSLNRGMWIGLGLAAAVVGLRQVAQGKVILSAALGVTLVAVSALLAFSPLSPIISGRLDNGRSNDVRASLADDSLNAATTSPIIGFGSTRVTLGADSSIAIGQSSDCPNCGNRDIGSTGQLWLVLIAQGVVGAGLYLGFFISTMWRYRRDKTVIGIAGTLVIGLESFYSLFYSALIIPLAVTLLAVALLWRNESQASATKSVASLPVAR